MAEQAARAEERPAAPHSTSELATRLREKAEQLGIPRSSLILLLDHMLSIGCLRLEPEQEADAREVLNSLHANGLRVVRA